MILTHNITKLQLSAVSPDQVEGICTKERNAVIYFWHTYLFQSVYVVSSVFKSKCLLCIYLYNSSYISHLILVVYITKVTLHQ